LIWALPILKANLKEEKAMKSVFKTLAMACAVSVMAAAAFANNPKYDEASISNLPSSGYVQVSGTVQSLDGHNRVMLRDTNGSTVNVLLSRNDYNKLKVGAPLTVRGNVMTSSSGRSINAIDDTTNNINRKSTTGDGTGPRWE
jgi:hypothetical protein